MNPNASELPRFVAAGEALTDMIALDDSATRWQSLCGGSTWNVARVMAALDVPSAFAGAISQDVLGDALWDASMASTLDPRFLQRLPHAPLLAMVYQTNPPKYFFVGDDSADLHFDPRALPRGWMQQCRWVHFGGISLAREPLAATLIGLAQELKRAGVRISYDPNFRAIMDERYDATLRTMAGLADVIKVSDEDLAGLFRTDDLEAALAALRSFNPQAQVLFTQGGKGASLLDGAQRWHAAAPVIDVADTVGAGDASIAGYLFSMMREPGAAPEQHLRFAVAAGAAACLSSGASAPTLEMIESLVCA